METFKSILFTFIGIAILLLIGFWAFSSMETGGEHATNQEIKKLKEENEDLKNQITKLNTENSLLLSEKQQLAKVDEAPVVEEAEKPEPIKTTTTTPIVALKYQDLINSLQNLINKSIFLERGSQGPSVGVIQKFLNIYNGTSNRIDNDFGKTTETAIKNYQKAVGLTADGKVGKTTLQKMVAYLKTKK